MKCFYHDVDHDGRGSAALIKLQYPECELIGLDYPSSFPWDKLNPGEKVYLIDLSLQPYSEMVRLAELVDLHWIDQHVTSIMGLKALGVDLQGLQAMGKAAIELTWEYLYGQEPQPLALRYIAAHQRWDHSDPNTQLFHYGLRLENTDPVNLPLWKTLLDNFGDIVHDLIDHGKLIQRYVEQEYKDYAKQAAFDTVLHGGVRALAVNRGLTGSPILDPLFNPKKHDVILVFYLQASLQRWRFSIYRPQFADTKVHCGELAAHYGGSGDFNAAGFSLPYIPFKLPVPSAQ